MPLSHEHVGFKISAKIKIYILSRAELLITLCYEIPYNVLFFKDQLTVLLLPNEFCRKTVFLMPVASTLSVITETRAQT